jgi:hypothetical protein
MGLLRAQPAERIHVPPAAEDVRFLQDPRRVIE